MGNRALRGIISIINAVMLPLLVTNACIPTVAFPVLIVGSSRPGPSLNPRTEICNLLLSVNGTDANIQTCLTATTISDADKALLCAASSGLTAAQIEILRRELIKFGVDVNTCDIFTGTTGTTATGQQSGNGITTQINSPRPSPSQSPTGTPTATPSISDADTTDSAPAPTPTRVNINVVITNSTIRPIGVSVSASATANPD